jgi:hypothetical protein
MVRNKAQLWTDFYLQRWTNRTLTVLYILIQLNDFVLF